jgi:hypothetical protein
MSDGYTLVPAASLLEAGGQMRSGGLRSDQQLRLSQILFRTGSFRHSGIMVSHLRRQNMAKKWNKVISRIQALEDALAGLLSGKSAKRKKAKKKATAKATAKVKTKAKPKRKASTKKPIKKKTAKPARAAAPARKVKPSRKKLRIVVAENAPILPQAPLLSL